MHLVFVVKRARITSWWTRMRRAFGSGNLACRAGFPYELLAKVSMKTTVSTVFLRMKTLVVFFGTWQKNIGTYWLVLPTWLIWSGLLWGQRLWCIGTIFVYLPIMKWAISLDDPPPSSGSLFWFPIILLDTFAGVRGVHLELYQKYHPNTTFRYGVYDVWCMKWAALDVLGSLSSPSVSKQ